MTRSCSQLAALFTLLNLTACVNEQANVTSRCEIELDLTAELGGETDSISIGDAPWVDVRAMKDGWAVLEFGGDVVLGYDQSGRFLGQLGRQGSGPGEYRDPTALTITPGGDMWISDRPGKIIVFDSDGNYVRSKLADRSPLVHAIGEGGYSATVLSRVLSDSVAPYYAVIFDSRGDSVRAIGPGAAPEVQHARYRFGLPQWITLTSDSTAYAVGDAGSVPSLLDYWHGTKHRTVVSLDDFWNAIAKQPNETVPSGYGLAVSRDRHERIWGQWVFLPNDANSDGDGIVWVADANGRLVATRSLDERPYGFSDRNHLYTIVESPSGLRTIRVWEHGLVCRDS